MKQIYVDFNDKDFVKALESLKGKLLITTEPEVPDFTDPQRPATLVILGEEHRIDLPLSLPEGKLRDSLGELRYYIGSSNVVVLGWNIKNFLSYVQGRTKTPWFLDSTILDLAIFESFAGIQGGIPRDYQEAKSRMGRLMSLDNWKQSKKMYQEVYQPLITKIVPDMETYGLNDLEIRNTVHPYYVISGQVNGRMNSGKMFSRSFTPHHLSDEDKKKLVPIGYDKVFLDFDFNYMEVSVLQWLSQDPDLGEILETGQDVYCAIWERLTSLPCSDKHRKICKRVFLPVVFGLGIEGLSKSLEISESTAKKLINGVYSLFPVCMAWAKNCQETVLCEPIREKPVHALTDCFGTDYFGRKRKFTTDQLYLVRNFKVQSPAALICLHKLVRLYDMLEKNDRNIKICYHLHDGYCIICNRLNWKIVRSVIADLLESEEELYPGLKLRVGCKMGERLDQMEKVESE